MPVSIQNIYIDPDLLFIPSLPVIAGEPPFSLHPKIMSYLERITEAKQDFNFYIIRKSTHSDSTLPDVLCLHYQAQNTLHTFTAEALFTLLKKRYPSLFTDKNSFSFISADQTPFIKNDGSAVLITDDPILKNTALCDIVSAREPAATSQPFLQKPTVKPFEINEDEFSAAKTQTLNTAEKIKIENALGVKTAKTKLVYSLDIDDTMIDQRETISRKSVVLNVNLVDKIAELINALIENGVDVTDSNQVEFIVLSARLDDKFHNEQFFSVSAILPLFISAVKNKTGIEIKFSHIYCLKEQDIVIFKEIRSDGISEKILESALFHVDSKKPTQAEIDLEEKSAELKKQFAIPTDSNVEITFMPLNNNNENLKKNKTIFVEYVLLPARTARGEKITLIQFDDDKDQLIALKQLGTKLLNTHNSEHRILNVSVHPNLPAAVPTFMPVVTGGVVIHPTRRYAFYQPRPLLEIPQQNSAAPPPEGYYFLFQNY